MKIFVVLIIVQIIPILSLTPSDNLGIGKSCTSNSQLIVTAFTVSPYPPVLGKLYSGTMTGVFSRNQTLSQMVVETTYNGSKFAKNDFAILPDYIYGVTYVFSFNLTAGTFTGLYNVQVFLQNKAGSFISCWEFAYHL